VSDASDTSLKKGTGARVTLRLSERELTALRELAEAREEDLSSIIREAISAYLSREQHRAEHERLAAEVAASVKREADRVIERHEHTTRALIAALNERLADKP
jgi:predicted transcriptional regulator